MSTNKDTSAQDTQALARHLDFLKSERERKLEADLAAARELARRLADNLAYAAREFKPMSEQWYCQLCGATNQQRDAIEHKPECVLSDPAAKELQDQ